MAIGEQAPVEFGDQLQLSLILILIGFRNKGDITYLNFGVTVQSVTITLKRIPKSVSIFMSFTLTLQLKLSSLMTCVTKCEKMIFPL